MSTHLAAWLVLPTYNEVENIVGILRSIVAIRKSIPTSNFSVVIVDSLSPDGTAQAANDFILKHGLSDSFHVITEKKRGLGQAYATGFDYAIEHGGDILLQMDSDFSHDPAVIPKLIASIQDGADMAIGSRYVTGGFIPGQWPLYRVVNSKVARYIARNVGGVTKSVSDPTGGFRAIRARIIEELDFDARDASGYVIMVKLVHDIGRAGYAIVEVPIAFADRTVGESKIRTKDIRQFVWFCIKLRFQKQPKKLKHANHNGAAAKSDGTLHS
jgi:dolichol-phosphate mannosyltransferase